MAPDLPLVPLSVLAEVNPPTPRLGVSPTMEASFIPMTDVSESGVWSRRQTRSVREVATGFTPFRDHDILFAKITPCMENGKGARPTGLVNGIGFGSTEFHVLRATSTSEPGFVFHWTQSEALRRRALAFMSGSAGQQRVQAAFFKRFAVPLFPKPEQARIAEVLDTVDEAIHSTEQVIAKLDQVKRGLLHDLLTRGIDDNGEIRDPVRHPEQFKDSPLGRIPKAWEILAVSKLLSARFPGEWGANPVGGQGNVKVLRSTNLDSEGHVDLTHGAERVVASRVLEQKRLRDGDLLLEAAGGGPGTPVGRVARFTDPGDGRIYCVSNFFRTLRPHRPLVLPTFLNWLLLARYRHPSIWRCQQQTTGIINLKMAEYERTLVRVPPKGEQDRAITLLQGVEAREKGESEGLQKLRLLKRGLMDDLLTGRVRVPLANGAA